MNGRAATLRIRTPEGVEFALPLAGPVTRCMAWLIDFLIVFALTMMLAKILNVLALFAEDLVGAVFAVCYFALTVGYGMAFEYYWGGRTPGKKLLGLRVADQNGLRLAARQVVIRNLLRMIDNLPAFYLVGGAAAFLSRRGQRLGDVAAATVVVRELKPRMPDLSRLEAARYNSLREQPSLCARLRQKSDPRAAGAALTALLRRERYEPAARVALFRDLAGYFRELVPFPAETVDGLSDEQYVRNVVEVLYG